MTAVAMDATSLEGQIDQWRNYLRRRQAIHPVDAAELEDAAWATIVVICFPVIFRFT